jgi:hypothetical protein
MKQQMRAWKSGPINVMQANDTTPRNTKLMVIAGAMVLWTIVFWGYQYLK